MRDVGQKVFATAISESLKLLNLKSFSGSIAKKFKIVMSPHFANQQCSSIPFPLVGNNPLQELFGPICFVGAFVVYCKYCQNCGTYWQSERHSVWGQNSNSIFNLFCFDRLRFGLKLLLKTALTFLPSQIRISLLQKLLVCSKSTKFAL